jgi:hypothetical protein
MIMKSTSPFSLAEILADHVGSSPRPLRDASDCLAARSRRSTRFCCPALNRRLLAGTLGPRALREETALPLRFVAMDSPAYWERDGRASRDDSNFTPPGDRAGRGSDRPTRAFQSTSASR